jgi:hypothetical protein
MAVLASGCSSDSTGAPSVKPADAYSAAIRWYVASVAAETPTTSDEGPIIVYVAPESGKAISSQTQASVVKELYEMSDTVTVRFADVRDEVLETDVENLPVKDDAVLLLVGEVHEAAPPLDVGVNVYHNAEDTHSYRMTIIASGDSFAATAVTEVAQG